MKLLCRLSLICRRARRGALLLRSTLQTLNEYAQSCRIAGVQKQLHSIEQTDALGIDSKSLKCLIESCKLLLRRSRATIR